MRNRELEFSTVSLIVVKHSSREIHHLTTTTLHNRVAFSTLMTLCARDHCLVLGHFHHPKRKPHALKQ